MDEEGNSLLLTQRRSHGEIQLHVIQEGSVGLQDSRTPDKSREAFRKQIGRTLPALKLPCRCSSVPRSWFPDSIIQKPRPYGHENIPPAPIPKGIGPNTKANEGSFTTSMADRKGGQGPWVRRSKLKSICDKDR